LIDVPHEATESAPEHLSAHIAEPSEAVAAASAAAKIAEEKLLAENDKRNPIRIREATLARARARLERMIPASQRALYDPAVAIREAAEAKAAAEVRNEYQCANYIVILIAF
jgi:acetyl-CoA carboxylase carboxyltransferase component